MVCLALACSGTPPRIAPAPHFGFALDSSRADSPRPGVVHRFLYAASGPWAIHVLEVDLMQCFQAVAVKGAPTAAGREKTSTLLQQLQASADVVGGVNADFFSLTLPFGVPSGNLISQGKVMTGPSAQPVVAIDSGGVPHLLSLRARGEAKFGPSSHPIVGWNHNVPGGLAYFDAAWGEVMDSVSGAIEVAITAGTPRRVLAIDTTRAGMVIPREGGVLIAGRGASAALRARMSTLRVGDFVDVSVALAPFHPLEAVGGRPMLLRDSVIPPIVDTEGQPGFATGRHPRTALGLARDSRTLLLVVVDGRQAPYSDGMTLRELANLMRGLGARDAINLDGGGSTTMVLADADSSHALRVLNRPSDATGERAVGDALAIVKGCQPR